MRKCGDRFGNSLRADLGVEHVPKLLSIAFDGSEFCYEVVERFCHFNWVLDRSERLFFQGFGATIPEEQRAESCVQDRGSLSTTDEIIHTE